MRVLVLSILSLLIVVSGVSIIRAQQNSREDLENRRTALLNEIAATQKLLDETKKDRNVSMRELNALKAQLNARQRLIDNINQEMVHINKNITSSSSEIQELNKNLAVLKMRYAQSVRYAYKNQASQNMLAFLFSSDNFNEAMQRYQYMKKSRDFRKSQANDIATTQLHLKKQINILSSEKNKKGSLLNVQEQQKSDIQAATDEANQMVTELRGKEKDLSTTIAQKQRTARQLNGAIKAEIKKEVELARKKAAEEARLRAEAESRAKAAEEARQKAAAALAKQKAEDERKKNELAKWEEDNRKRAAEEAAKKNGTTVPATNQHTIASNNTPAKSSTPTTQPPATDNSVPAIERVTNATTPSYKLSLTPEVQNLSDNFAANRGRLPWPVASGFVSAPFGRYQHPLEPKVTMENSGIDISTNANAAARAVFEGVVSKVVNIAGSYTVIINHGEYFSVYSFLNQVSVKAGDHVSIKQNIGTVGKNDDGDNVIHFEICHVNANNSISNENPSTWIAR